MTITLGPLGQTTILQHLQSPLERTSFPRPGTRQLRLIFEGPVSADDAAWLGAYSAAYETTHVVIGHNMPLPLSLDFLSHFPAFSGFTLLSYKFTQFSELEHIPESIQELELGELQSSQLPLDILARFPHLESLSLSGHITGCEAIGELDNLKKLFLYMMTLPDPGLLGSLSALKHLVVMHGGMSDLSVVSSLADIEHIQLWRVRGLDNLDWLAGSSALKILELGALSKVKELPSFQRLTNLEKVHLEQMNGLQCISALKDARNLESVHISQMNQLPMESYESLRGHPSLCELTPGYSSKKKQRMVASLLNLPHVVYPAGGWDVSR